MSPLYLLGALIPAPAPIPIPILALEKMLVPEPLDRLAEVDFYPSVVDEDIVHLLVRCDT